MALSPRTVRISAALLLSAIFIAAGYYFSSPFQLTIAGAASTDQLLKEYAKKDTDADGLPDWQESLYGTDPNNPHSVDPLLTDGEAVSQGKVAPKFRSETPPPERVTGADIPGEAPGAGTLTDRFAKEFFQNFILSQNAGGRASSADVQKFVESAVDDILQEGLQRNAFTSATVVVSGTGPDALRAYAVTMAASVGAPAGGAEKDELSYLNDALIGNDLTALKKITAIAAAYKATAEDMRTVPVPQELAATHLELMNTAMRLAESLENMAAFKEDPLRTFLGIKQYPSAGARLIRGLAALDAQFRQARVSFTSGDAGYPFYAVLEQAAAALSSLPAE